ncbi:MAG: type II toxin-antitoxin system VapC family toxin [Pirellulales bacterium]
MIFVDTGVWYAALVAEDADHLLARSLFLNASSKFVTTDYVVDELLTLLVARSQRDVAVQAGKRFWSGRYCQLHWVTPDDVAAAWNIFVSFDDKRWSFTDCVSYAVMKRLGVTEAFALDDDFRQFGFVSVRP